MKNEKCKASRTLAQRLIESNQPDNPAAQAEEEGMSKEEIQSDLRQAFHEVKLYQEGKIQFRRAEELLDEL